ncbi:MAG: hypothetical protein QXL15_01145 [Candidatus Korarchaeota archaeon]
MYVLKVTQLGGDSQIVFGFISRMLMFINGKTILHRGGDMA